MSDNNEREGSMRSYGEEADNVYDAVDYIVQHGVVAISGTKQSATRYAERVISCLEPYDNIEPIIGFYKGSSEGYLYYIYDNNRFQTGSNVLEDMLKKI